MSYPVHIVAVGGLIENEIGIPVSLRKNDNHSTAISIKYK
jgi:hypothetical protein